MLPQIKDPLSAIRPPFQPPASSFPLRGLFTVDAPAIHADNPYYFDRFYCSNTPLMESPLPPPPEELLRNNETVDMDDDSAVESHDVAVKVINDAFKFTSVEDALSTVSCFEARLLDRSTIVEVEERTCYTENNVSSVDPVGKLEVSAASTPKISKRRRAPLKPAKRSYYSSESDSDDSDVSEEWMKLEKTKGKWHTPSSSFKFDLTEDSPRNPQTRYTTSLAAISTPTSCTRVFSQKKHPYSPQSLKLDSAAFKTRSLPAPINELPAPSAHLEDKPYAASTPQGSFTHRRLALNSIDSFLSFETTMEHVPDGNFRAGLKRLAKKIHAEEAHITEARTSILYWRRKEGSSKNLNHELSAQALLLISQIRLNVYRELVTRIHTFYRMSVGPHPISKAVLSCFKVHTITVNLCKNYYTRTNPENAGWYYAFVIVLSSHEKVIATELQHIVEDSGMNAKRIRIDEEIVFNNLPLTFQIKLEVFSVKIATKAGYTPKELAKRAFNFIGQCRSPPISSVKVVDEEEDVDDLACDFKPAGYAHLDRSMIGHKSFLLLQNEYPLEGCIDVKASCSLLPPALREVTTGYWRLLSSDNSVVRYWVRMVNGVINFYKTPEGDPNRTTSNSIPTFTTNAENEPLFMIDISTICNRTVERETAIFSTSTDRRFCFYMDVVSFPRGSDLCEHKRFLVGVDSEAELIKWVKTINKVIDVVRNPA